MLDSIENEEGRKEDKTFLTLTIVLIGILELCIPREEFISRITVTVETSFNILTFSIWSTIYAKRWFALISILNTREKFGHSFDKHLLSILYVPGAIYTLSTSVCPGFQRQSDKVMVGFVISFDHWLWLGSLRSRHWDKDSSTSAFLGGGPRRHWKVSGETRQGWPRKKGIILSNKFPLWATGVQFFWEPLAGNVE